METEINEKALTEAAKALRAHFISRDAVGPVKSWNKASARMKALWMVEARQAVTAYLEALENEDSAPKIGRRPSDGTDQP